MATPLAIVRSWESRQCPSWGRPVDVAWSAGCNSHRFLVRWKIPTSTCSLLTGQPVRNRLSDFQFVHGFSASAGRCSSVLMLRCTLASRGSSRSLHSSKRAASAVVLMGSVLLMKLFRDFRRRLMRSKQPFVLSFGSSTHMSMHVRPSSAHGCRYWLVTN